MLLTFEKRQNKHKTKSMKWTDVFVKGYCLINGFKVKNLTTREELLASFHLKNKVNHSLYGLPPWEAKEQFIHPAGVACIIGIYKKDQLIGSIHLMDLSKIDSYTSKIFSTATLDYNPKKTYEIKSFIVDKDFQTNIGVAFNMLIYYSIRHTEKTGRNNWLVSTRDTFYHKIQKKSGLPTKFISADSNYINDGTAQARYFQNYASVNGLENTCCFYINIPKRIVGRLAIKFIRIITKKTIKRWFSAFRTLRTVKQ